MTNTTIYPQMMLYRLRRFGDRQGIFLGYVKDESVELRLAAQKLTDAWPELFRVETKRGQGSSLMVDAGPRPSLAVLSAELLADARACGDDRSFSSFDLLAAVIAKGDMFGTYGSHYWADMPSAVHVLTCGIDWEKFRGVMSSRWTEWNGTFAEDSSVDMLDVSLDCRCGEVRQVKFGLAPPSLADLIVSLDAGLLERLFDA